MYCLEYSKKQNAFHIQKLTNSVTSNLKQFRKYMKDDKLMPDYVIIAINKDRNILDKICDNYKILRDKKEDIKYFKKLPYKEYLKTDHWLKLKEEIHYIYNDLCGKCGGSKKLQVHHKTYERLGHEKKKDLILLCEKCHSKEHGIG